MNNLKVAYTFKMECYNAYKKLVNELSSSEKKNSDNLSNESTFDINNATSLLDYFKNNRVKKHDIIRKHKTKGIFIINIHILCIPVPLFVNWVTVYQILRNYGILTDYAFVLYCIVTMNHLKYKVTCLTF